MFVSIYLYGNVQSLLIFFFISFLYTINFSSMFNCENLYFNYAIQFFFEKHTKIAHPLKLPTTYSTIKQKKNERVPNMSIC